MLILCPVCKRETPWTSWPSGFASCDVCKFTRHYRYIADKGKRHPVAIKVPPSNG
jgi:hypothetical protein